MKKLGFFFGNLRSFERFKTSTRIQDREKMNIPKSSRAISKKYLRSVDSYKKIELGNNFQSTQTCLYV